MMNLIGKRNIAFVFSAVAFVASIIILISFGLRLGIDFTGGSLMELSFAHGRPDANAVQTALADKEIGDVLVQPTEDNGMILRMKFLGEDAHQDVLATMREEFGGEDVDGVPSVREDRFETIGPAISSQLKRRSIGAAIAVVIAIILYVAYSFRRVSKPVASWKYGVAAIVALVHDVTITMAVLAILGKTIGLEMSIPIVVALLTILGYSVNDTIVVFDRVRENLIKRGSRNFDETVNMGVNQSFTRSINTSVTTLIVLLTLFFFGGESIKPFALTLTVGIILGTYSSIFLASPLLVFWHQRKNK